jgi:hypothetical protein
MLITSIDAFAARFTKLTSILDEECLP